MLIKSNKKSLNVVLGLSLLCSAATIFCDKVDISGWNNSKNSKRIKIANKALKNLKKEKRTRENKNEILGAIVRLEGELADMSHNFLDQLCYQPWYWKCLGMAGCVGPKTKGLIDEKTREKISNIYTPIKNTVKANGWKLGALATSGIGFGLFASTSGKSWNSLLFGKVLGGSLAAIGTIAGTFIEKSKITKEEDENEEEDKYAPLLKAVDAANKLCLDAE